MLLIAFSCLPPAVQLHVAADLQAQVSAHAAADSHRPVTDWAALLTTLNPALSFDPATECLNLPAEGWAQLLQFAQPYLRPRMPVTHQELVAA